MTGAFAIVDFEDRYARGFREVNLAWIEELFYIEAEDERQLAEPQRILDAGGEILLGVIGDRVVGSCALIVHGEGEFELAKFTVARDQRHSGMGFALLEHTVQRARDRGMQKVTLLTNSKLTTARRLFERVGFHEVRIVENPYEAADVAMALNLSD